MGAESKPGFFARVLQFLGLRPQPPDIGVREPRRPVPSSSGGVVTLERPDSDERE